MKGNTTQRLLLSGVAVLFYLILQFSSFAKTADLRSQDLFRSGHQPHPSITILAIDNKSIGAIGRWPWSRTVQAQILNKLSISKPQLVIMDINFSEPQDAAADGDFAQSLSQAGFPVILAAEAVFTNGQSVPASFLKPLPVLTAPKNVSTGLANVDLSQDGLARAFPKPLNYSGTTYLPLSFQAAKLLNAPLPSNDKKYVNFAGPAGTFATYSVSDVLSGKVPVDQLQGKIVLIGATASDLHDNLLVPQSNQVMAGVEYHANVLDNILLNRSIKAMPASYTRIIGLVVLLILLALLFTAPRRLTLYAALTVIIVLPLISLVLWHKRISLSYFQNTILAVLFLALYGLYSWYITEREKRQIRQTFQNYFSPSVMAAILEDPSLLKLGGKKAEVTIFFSDIRGFTTISESLPPEKLATLLNEYFTAMTEEILATDGVVDKFIGDAIMAFWGAPIAQPDQADRAVKAAGRMVLKLKKLQAKWEEEGYPYVDIGIGINSGTATVGNMGSDRRFDYTVIGDDVNLASRLEGLNKEHKTNIIISQATKDKLKIKAPTRSLGEVTVKGKTKPVNIYEVIVK